MAMIALCTTACGWPPTPPLLRDVSAGGGWWGQGCPRTEADGDSPEALSPQLDRRLRASFPPGSPARRLVQTLSEQGFGRAEHRCPGEPAISSATFHQYGVGLAGMTADVAWREDAKGAIVWTKGHVAYEGL